MITTLQPNRQNMRNMTDQTQHTSSSLENEPAPQEPSKTRVKQAMLTLQSLGEQLITLNKQELHTLALPEKLHEAILEAKRITDWGAIKRQKQYIGRLMRDVDAAPLQAYMDNINGVSKEHTAWLHRLEKLRESLLAEDQALASLLNDYPSTEIQILRTLIRNARKEKIDNKPPKHFRALFQKLKELIPEPSLPQSPIASSEDELA